MEEASVATKAEDYTDLPPGFRFHPTDEEIITHYLREKVLNSSFTSRAVGEVDLNKCEPWDLPGKAKMGEKEWYFFYQRDRKYPTGMRTNRATEAGYWKATGKDKEIYKGKGCLVGMKKTLVFYRGRAPKGEKTNWVMHEYRLEGKFSYYNLPKSAKDEWVVCRVFHKSTGIKRSPITGLLRMNSFGDDHLVDSPSMPPLADPTYFNPNRPSSSYAFNDLDFKANDGGYFSTAMNNNNQQDLKTFLPNDFSNIPSHQNPYGPPQTSISYPQVAHSNPTLTLPGSAANLGYLHQARSSPLQSFGASEVTMLRAIAAAATHDHQSTTAGLKNQCKLEQFSNQSIVSQETGASTDVNTEISSVFSKHDQLRSTGCHENMEGPVDLECLWNY